MKSNKLAIGLLVTFFVLLSGCTVPQDTPTEEEKAITIGISQWVSNPEYDRNIQGFKDGIAENGYIEGENVEFLIENPDVDKERQRSIMQSFVDKEWII